MYYSIFDFQGTVGLCFSIGWLKQTLLRKAHPFGLWSVRDDFSDEKSFPAASRLERQLVYLSTRILPCQQEKGIIFEKNLAYFDSYKI